MNAADPGTILLVVVAVLVAGVIGHVMGIVNARAAHRDDLLVVLDPVTLARMVHDAEGGLVAWDEEPVELRRVYVQHASVLRGRLLQRMP